MKGDLIAALTGFGLILIFLTGATLGHNLNTPPQNERGLLMPGDTP